MGLDSRVSLHRLSGKLLLFLNDDYEGGEFATLEPDGSQRLHPLPKGSAVCLVSHKYHSVRPVLRGERRSLVMELWQGGISGMGRG